MSQLHEDYRPTSWSEVVGQDKAVAKINRLRSRGLTGRSFWMSGQSGTGKTTIARLIAAEVASDWSIEEIDATDLSAVRVRELERQSQCKGMGGKTGRALIVNESHGLNRAAVRQLLTTLERIPGHVAWLFTTTNDGQESLFDEQIEPIPCCLDALSYRFPVAAWRNRLPNAPGRLPRQRDWMGSRSKPTSGLRRTTVTISVRCFRRLNRATCWIESSESCPPRRLPSGDWRGGPLSHKSTSSTRLENHMQRQRQPKHQTETKHVFAFFLAIIALLLLMSWNDSQPIYKPKAKTRTMCLLIDDRPGRPPRSVKNEPSPKSARRRVENQRLTTSHNCNVSFMNDD